ncbi:MAG: DUF2333 family protein [Alphaproteobacteria bacterium]|nr:DUF2333 family protein [Alphaproteobacteria bacterium]
MKKYVRKLLTKFKQIVRGAGTCVGQLFSNWPKAFISVVALMILAYYPLGGRLSENIDKRTEYDFSSMSEKQSQTIEIIEVLIDREVNQNIWTPNLPLFFPAYCLDNMPNFQKGIVRGVRGFMRSLSKSVRCGDNDDDLNYLKNAMNFLAYPENVWLVSPTNKLKIAPSSSSQYRKARKNLKKFNNSLEEERCFWLKDEKSLYNINNAAIRGLKTAERQLKNEIREGNKTWFDTSADNVFYLNQGRIYAQLMILTKLGRDYKQVLTADDLYQDWTVMLRALQDAVEISPEVVLNGNLSSALMPNHLVSMAYYVVKAEKVLMKINARLNGEIENAN